MTRAFDAAFNDDLSNLHKEIDAEAETSWRTNDQIAATDSLWLAINGWAMGGLIAGSIASGHGVFALPVAIFSFGDIPFPFHWISMWNFGFAFGCVLLALWHSHCTCHGWQAKLEKLREKLIADNIEIDKEEHWVLKRGIKPNEGLTSREVKILRGLDNKLIANAEAGRIDAKKQATEKNARALNGLLTAPRCDDPDPRDLFQI